MKSFEEKLNRLEIINQLLKENDQSFNESQKLYKEGIDLSKSLEGELEKAENMIEELNPSQI